MDIRLYKDGAVIEFQGHQFFFSMEGKYWYMPEKLLQMSRSGMSGCKYGPMLPLVGELFHVTMSGQLDIQAPLLIDNQKIVEIEEFTEGKFSIILNRPVGEGTDSIFMEPAYVAPRWFNETAVDGMLFQLFASQDEWLVNRIMGQMPLFAMRRALYYIYTKPSSYSCQLEGSRVDYLRKVWPERPVVEIEGFSNSFEAIRASIKYLRETRHYSLGAAMLEIETKNRWQEIYIAKPPGRGVIAYSVSTRPYSSQVEVRGMEKFQDIEHAPCQISLQLWDRKLVHEALWPLIHRRLGDVMFLTDEEHEKVKKFYPWLFEAREEQLNKVTCLSDGEEKILVHPEHGMLTVSKDARAYAVPYVPRQGGHAD